MHHLADSMTKLCQGGEHDNAGGESIRVVSGLPGANVCRGTKLSSDQSQMYNIATIWFTYNNTCSFKSLIRGCGGLPPLITL